MIAKAVLTAHALWFITEAFTEHGSGTHASLVISDILPRSSAILEWKLQVCSAMEEVAYLFFTTIYQLITDTDHRVGILGCS